MPLVSCRRAAFNSELQLCSLLTVVSKLKYCNPVVC